MIVSLNKKRREAVYIISFKGAEGETSFSLWG